MEIENTIEERRRLNQDRGFNLKKQNYNDSEEDSEDETNK